MKDRAKKGCVDFLTNPKVIQAFLTGSTFGVLNRVVNLISQGLGPTQISPQTVISTVIMAFVATFWYWVDRHQATFTELVEEATGEDANPDS